MAHLRFHHLSSLGAQSVIVHLIFIINRRKSVIIIVLAIRFLDVRMIYFLRSYILVAVQHVMRYILT